MSEGIISLQFKLTNVRSISSLGSSISVGLFIRGATLTHISLKLRNYGRKHKHKHNRFMSSEKERRRKHKHKKMNDPCVCVCA